VCEPSAEALKIGVSHQQRGTLVHRFTGHGGKIGCFSQTRICIKARAEMESLLERVQSIPGTERDLDSNEQVAGYLKAE